MNRRMMQLLQAFGPAIPEALAALKGGIDSSAVDRIIEDPNLLVPRLAEIFMDLTPAVRPPQFDAEPIPPSSTWVETPFNTGVPKYWAYSAVGFGPNNLPKYPMSIGEAMKLMDRRYSGHLVRNSDTARIIQYADRLPEELRQYDLIMYADSLEGSLLKLSYKKMVVTHDWQVDSDVRRADLLQPKTTRFVRRVP